MVGEQAGVGRSVAGPAAHSGQLAELCRPCVGCRWKSQAWREVLPGEASRVWQEQLLLNSVLKARRSVSRQTTA